MSEINFSAELSVSDVVAEASQEELADRLKKHYEYVSCISHEWSNQVEKAIDFYCEYKAGIKKLQARLDEAEKVIDFYGDEYESWSGHSIANSDMEITVNNRPSGGKRAREYQEKYKDEG